MIILLKISKACDDYTMKKEQGFIQIILILIIVIVVGVFVIGKNKVNSVVTVGTPMGVTSVPTGNNVDITNWKTYTNNLFNVSLKSPYENPMQSVNFEDYKNGQTFFTLNNKFIFETNKLKICVLPSNEMCIIPGKNWGQSTDLEQINLDGVKATSFFIYEPISNQVIHVVQTEDPKIEISTNVDGGGLEDIFMKIISTFKFTN
ncbi:hypothetical protein BH10PAT1_BH10PAT1_5580 [soil metagenome]